MPSQPTRYEKLRVLEGLASRWTYTCTAPPVCTAYWNADDWINWIGCRWFRK